MQGPGPIGAMLLVAVLFLCGCTSGPTDSGSLPVQNYGAGHVAMSYERPPTNNGAVVTWNFAVQGTDGLPSESLNVNMTVSYYGRPSPTSADQTQVSVANGTQAVATLHTAYWGLGDYWVDLEAHDSNGTEVGKFTDVWMFCLCANGGSSQGAPISGH
ncbi:MAG: hypothetical protein ACYDDF_02395 [Thermoplasmatota archaeon]